MEEFVETEMKQELGLTSSTIIGEFTSEIVIYPHFYLAFIMVQPLLSHDYIY